MPMYSSDVASIIDDPLLRHQTPAIDAAETFLALINRLQPHLHALVSITERQARQDARRVDRARYAGTPLPLDGMPLVIKDNLDVAGCVTTNGSRAFGNAVPDIDAEVISRLRAAGAIMLGKSHLHELAFGVSSDSAHGRCVNPWNIDRIPGGSSSGSGVAVAADLCIGAIGTDTGGSVRVPAAASGVVGLRPTIGAISTRGTFPVAQTFDTVGPMARSVLDVERMFNVMVGYDLLDPWSRRCDKPRAAPPIEHVRIGVPREYFFDDLDPEISVAIDDAIDQFAALGAPIYEIKIPGVPEACETYSKMVCAEALANYQSLLRAGAPLLESTAERLRLGAVITGSDLANAHHQMMKWQRSLEGVFRGGVDVILTPTLKTQPCRLADHIELRAIDEMTKTTRPWSLARMPAMTIPCGFSGDGSPISFQLATLPWHESFLFKVGATYQTATAWHLQRPECCSQL